MSEYNGPDDAISADLKNIEATAKVNNYRHNITGVLFHFDRKFLQVIEGAEDNLRALMEKISLDPRHHNIDYLVDTPVEFRGFEKWNMDTLNLNNPAEFNVDNMRSLTKNFEENLLPRSDALIYFYRKLLGA